MSLDPAMLVDMALLTLICLCALAVMAMRHLFAAAALTGAFSLISAGLLVSLDAVDVAFTEAAVGAGISTVLMLGTLALTQRRERKPPRFSPPALLATIALAAALLYATPDMPRFGDPDAPAIRHVIPEYIAGARTDIQVPNIVTAILASYRGYDTLGEVVVIFIAGVGVMFLLGRRRRDETQDVIRKRKTKAEQAKQAEHANQANLTNQANPANHAGDEG